MRHCFNEDVQLFQKEGCDVGQLLMDAGRFLGENNDDGWVNLHLQKNFENEDYILTVYIHN